MIVSELIKKLQQFPPETLVATSCCNSYDVESLNGKKDLANDAALMNLHQINNYPEMFMEVDDPNEEGALDAGDGDTASATPTPIIVIE